MRSPALRESWRQTCCGFSLVETLMALAVFGLLLSAVAPMARATLVSAKHRASVRQYKSIQALAKSQAIEHRRVSELYIDEASGRVWIELDTTRARSGRKDTLRLADFGSLGIRIDANKKLICFEAGGARTEVGDCEGGKLEVRFKLGKREIKVTTTELGKVLR